MTAMNAIAGMLVERGLNRIDGRILADTSFFSGPTRGERWPKDAAWNTWMVEVTPLVFNDNYTVIRCRPDGSKCRAESVPNCGYVEVENRLSLTDRRSEEGVSLWRAKTANRFKVSGRVYRKGAGAAVKANVYDGALYFVSALKKALESRGVTVGGGVDRASSPPDKIERIFVYTSKLTESLPVMLKQSQNLYAELFFRTIGARKGGAGSFAGGQRALRDWLADEDILEPDVAFADGSGLSRANAISARQLTGVLTLMWNTDHRGRFRDALAEPGRSGTLRRRMPALAGKVAAKTGTLNGVSALSGYVQARAKRWLAFSILCNDCNKSRARQVQDRICAAIHELGR